VSDLSRRVLVRLFGRDAEIVLSPQIDVIGEGCFSWCESFELVRFECDVSRLEEAAFLASGLTVIPIPGSVEAIRGKSFAGCTSLPTVTFSGDSKLSRLELGAFLRVD
jgi:hypothetical protein